MNILIGNRDRDFLRSFSKLFELEGHTVDTVFDGTQVITSMAGKKPELVILEAELPRVRNSQLVRLLNDEQIPVIIVMGRKLKTADLLGTDTGSSYISLPFLPAELLSLTEDLVSKRKNGGILRYEDAEMDIGKFLLCGRQKVTNEEINVFQKLADKQDIDPKKATPYIGALNNKLELLGCGTRIKYKLNEGYRLVMNNE